MDPLSCMWRCHDVPGRERWMKFKQSRRQVSRLKACSYASTEKKTEESYVLEKKMQLQTQRATPTPLIRPVTPPQR